MASPLLIPFLTLLATFVIATTTLTLITKLFGTKHPRHRPPPGPRRVPIIGNLHQLVSALPHRRLRDLAHKHGPDIMHLQLGELSHIVISSAEAAREVMKTHDVVFASRPSILGADIVVYAGKDLAFTPYNDFYRKLRKTCVVELLGAHRVRSFRPIREKEAAALVDSLSRSAAKGETVDVGKALFQLTSRATRGSAFGKLAGDVDGEEFFKMVERIADVLGGFRVSDLFPSLTWLPVVTGFKSQLMEIHRKLDRMLDDMISEYKERRAAAVAAAGKGVGGGVVETEDLLDVLLNLHESQSLDFSLTLENVKAVTLEIFLAGVETSATAMDWTMAELVRDPRVMRIAQEEVRRVYRGKHVVDESSVHELEYLDMVIQESLRLHPPLPLLLPRESTEQVQVMGYDIPPKTKVIVNGWAIGRDPRYWGADAEKFYPERFLKSTSNYKGTDHFDFIPFGAGRRMCPGILYGTSVVKLTLANLLFHFDWKLPDGSKPEDLDMTERFGSSARRECNLCLIPVAYDAM
ncbi:unnamed protein product [Linum tenue]|uniref:Uncharacterized protein n=1 Tax=Linum tenue TaxID=586396 RepID=A0AAV0KEI8_9ROSI|nr:unnamed protein product [Linum tenue]